MKRSNTRGRLLPLLPSRRRTPSSAALFETFHARTFPHLDAIYSDAFCLTGCEEDAADLVIETYLRAFESYPQFQRRHVQRRHVPEHLQTHRTRTWLYGNLHAAFCDGVLAQAGQPETQTGE